MTSQFTQDSYGPPWEEANRIINQQERRFPMPPIIQTNVEYLQRQIRELIDEVKALRAEIEELKRI